MTVSKREKIMSKREEGLNRIVYGRVFISLGNIPKSEIAGSHGNCLIV